ncbi:hypothetical protein DFJ73DRAFT_957166 [Zopfochytrium polystomum]|nr:hypothetical protein DFJ73DRAFT_957166 [Zopfochytrium polystomum]
MALVALMNDNSTLDVDDDGAGTSTAAPSGPTGTGTGTATTTTVTGCVSTAPAAAAAAAAPAAAIANPDASSSAPRPRIPRITLRPHELAVFRSKIIRGIPDFSSPYYAVSHVWGPNARLHDLVHPTSGDRIGGIIIESEDKFHAVLRVVGDLVDSVVWWDVVSIDQDDEKDKCAQVNVMHEIYSLAQGVIVFLSHEDYQTLTRLTEYLARLSTTSFSASFSPPSQSVEVKRLGVTRKTRLVDQSTGSQEAPVLQRPGVASRAGVWLSKITGLMQHLKWRSSHDSDKLPTSRSFPQREPPRLGRPSPQPPKPLPSPLPGTYVSYVQATVGRTFHDPFTSAPSGLGRPSPQPPARKLYPSPDANDTSPHQGPAGRTFYNPFTSTPSGNAPLLQAPYYSAYPRAVLPALNNTYPTVPQSAAGRTFYDPHGVSSAAPAPYAAASFPAAYKTHPTFPQMASGRTFYDPFGGGGGSPAPYATVSFPITAPYSPAAEPSSSSFAAPPPPVAAPAPASTAFSLAYNKRAWTFQEKHLARDIAYCCGCGCGGGCGGGAGGGSRLAWWGEIVDALESWDHGVVGERGVSLADLVAVAAPRAVRSSGGLFGGAKGGGGEGDGRDDGDGHGGDDGDRIRAVLVDFAREPRAASVSKDRVFAFYRLIAPELRLDYAMAEQDALDAVLMALVRRGWIPPGGPLSGDNTAQPATQPASGGRPTWHPTGWASLYAAVASMHVHTFTARGAAVYFDFGAASGSVAAAAPLTVRAAVLTTAAVRARAGAAAAADVERRLAAGGAGAAQQAAFDAGLTIWRHAARALGGAARVVEVDVVVAPGGGRRLTYYAAVAEDDDDAPEAAAAAVAGAAVDAAERVAAATRGGTVCAAAGLFVVADGGVGGGGAADRRKVVVGRLDVVCTVLELDGSAVVFPGFAMLNEMEREEIVLV